MGKDSMLSRYKDFRNDGASAMVAFAMARFSVTPYGDGFHFYWERRLFGKIRLPLKYLSNREIVTGGWKKRPSRLSVK